MFIDRTSWNLQPHENYFEKLAMCSETLPGSWNILLMGRQMTATSVWKCIIGWLMVDNNWCIHNTARPHKKMHTFFIFQFWLWYGLFIMFCPYIVFSLALVPVGFIQTDMSEIDLYPTTIMGNRLCAQFGGGGGGGGHFKNTYKLVNLGFL